MSQEVCAAMRMRCMLTDCGEARMAVRKALGHVWGLSFVGVM
jgi:hypothetical protein